MFYVGIMKLIGLIALLKGITEVGVWSLIGIAFGVLLIYLGCKFERNYT